MDGLSFRFDRERRKSCSEQALAIPVEPWDIRFSRRHETVPLSAFLLLCMLSLIGCFSSTGFYLRDELANRGPIALSGANPYISSNLFLGHEMERSAVLKGFIEYRGTPDALDVKSEMLKPLKLSLYYLEELELYTLEEAPDDWIVRGPERIPPQFATAFTNIPGAGRSAPLVLNGKVESNILKGAPNIIQAPSVMPGERDPVVEEELTEIKPAKPKLPTTTKPGVRAAPKPESPPRVSPPKSLPSAAKPTATLGDAELTKKGEVSVVEESSSGDIIHRVTFPGESLEAITAWYTGDPANAERLARINGLEIAAALRAGQNVRIPRYLLRTSKPMPRSEIGR